MIKCVTSHLRGILFIECLLEIKFLRKYFIVFLFNFFDFYLFFFNIKYLYLFNKVLLFNKYLCI